MLSLVPSLSFLCTVAACASTLAAQGNTWIVDRSNGPGTHFTDIPPALAAAQTGDKIIVRGGRYTGGTIDKGIWLLAEAGKRPTVIPPAENAPTIRVTGIAAHLYVVVAGLRPHPLAIPAVGLPTPSSFLELSNCSGRVHLNQSVIHMSFARPELAGSTDSKAITITNCAHVTIHEVTTLGLTRIWGPANVAVSGSSFVGHSVLQQGPGGAAGCLDSGPAIQVSGSSLTMSRSSAHGGNGGPIPCSTLGSEAISASGGSRVTIAGDGLTVLAAGNGSNAIDAISGTGAVIEADPRVQLVGSGGGSGVSGGHQHTSRPIPSVAANDAAPGDTVNVDLLATQGDIAEIYMSLPWGPIPGFWPNSGEIWVRFGAVAVLGRFTIPASDQVSVSIPIPNAALLQGFPLTFQAITVSLQNGFRFSTPATPVLN